MKLQYCSDLHLEFRENSEFMKKNPLQVKGDILLLAGDIVPFAIMDKQKAFFDFAADNFEQTYWVPGNHEYYHSDIARRSGILNEKIRSNVSLVNNVAIGHGALKLICATMWSKISPAHEWDIERSMNDFHTIKYSGYRFSSQVYNRLHEESLAFIAQELGQKDDSNKVVVTHHVPTYMHYPEQYKGDILSEAFAVELFDLIEPSGALLWLYGHHHSNTADFKIGATTLATNQLGYVKYGEHTLFDNGRIFTV